MIARVDLTGFFHVAFSVTLSERALNVGNFNRRESDQGGMRDQWARSNRNCRSFGESTSTMT